MTRHTDTWVFNIDSEVWDDCLGHETGDEGDEDITPRFGFTDTDDVSPDDFRGGILSWRGSSQTTLGSEQSSK